MDLTPAQRVFSGKHDYKSGGLPAGEETARALNAPGEALPWSSLSFSVVKVHIGRIAGNPNPVGAGG